MKRLTVLLSIIILTEASGQNLQPLTLKPGADTARGLYFTTLDEFLPIHNGRVFYGYPGVLETAFYPESGWYKGDVLFEGIWYRDVQIMYDTYMDEVILLHPQGTPLRLVGERIQKFQYEGIYFERLGPETDPMLKSGFYQRAIEGPLTIYVKRTRRIEENIVDLAIERKFVNTYLYYAFKDGRYTAINKQKSVMELVKDKRQGVVHHLKQQNLKYRKNREKAIMEMAAFYNQSPN